MTGTDDATVITGTSTASLTETDAIQSTGGTLIGTDPDSSAAFVTQTNVGGSNGYGKFSITTGGVWTYSMNSAHNEFVAGTAYTDSITVATADGTTQVITVTIAGTNDAAVISGTTSVAVIEASGTSNAILGTPTATGTLTDTDVDNPANTFTAVPSGIANYGTYTMTAGGVWTYTLNNSNATVQALNVGGTLTDTFTVTTVDGTPKIVTVTINGANDAPVNTIVTPIYVTEDVASTITGISVGDIDSSGSITVTLNVPAGTLTASTGGGVTITGSNSDTLVLVGTQANINAFILASGVTYTTAGNASGSVVMTMTSSDGLLTDIDNITLNITAVNDAPVNTVPATQTTAEDTSKAITGLAISDVADGNSGSMEVTLTVTNGTLTVTGGAAGIAGSGTGSVTLTGTVAEINATLAATVSYVPTANFNGTATLTMTTSDLGNTGIGGIKTDVDTVSIIVTAVNDAPTTDLNGAGGGINNTTTFTEQTLLLISPSATINDVDSPNLSSMTLTLTARPDGNAIEALSLNSAATTAAAGLIVSYTAATGVLQITGSASQATYQTILQGVQYNDTSDTPNTTPRTVNVVVNDGALSSTQNTITINVTPVNDAPVLATGSTLAYTENGAAAAINSLITVTDPDNATLVSGTVSITTNFASGQDVLAFTNVPATMGNIAGSYNAGTGVMSLTSAGGTATTLQWQAALRAVTYANSSNDPTTTARTISFVVNDSALNSNTVTSAINITAVNDAPVLANGSTLAYTENGAAAAIDNAITVADPDNANLLSGTVSITTNFVAGQDVLAFTNAPLTMGNIAGSYNASTGVMSLTSAGGTATTAQWQAALRAVTYANSSEDPSTTTRTVSFVVNDSALNSNTVTSTINVTTVNDAPTLTATTVNVTSIETAAAANTAPSALLFSGAAFNTIEAGQTIKGMTFVVTGLFDGANETIVVDGTTISLGANIAGWTATNGLVYTSVVSGGTATVTLSGGSLSAAAAATLVNSISYQDIKIDNPTAGARTFTLSQVQDSGGTANSGADTSVGSIASTVTVAVTNDAPVIDLDASAAGFGYSTTYSRSGGGAGGVGVKIVDSDVLITDVDSTNITGATIAITTNRNSSGTDSLAFTNTANITGVYTAGTGTLVLTSAPGTATLADYQAALRSVIFDNTGATASANRTITVQVTDGSGSPSNIANTTVAFSNVATPTAIVAVATGNEDDTNIRIVLNGLDNVAVTRFQVASNPAGGTLYTNTSFTTAVTLNTDIAATNNSLTLYFKPNLNYNNLAGTTFNFKAGDATSLTANTTATIVVNPVNDAPVLADTVLSLTALSQNSPAPVGAVGNLVSSLVGGVTDVDAAAVKGVAIIATDSSNGTWYFTTNAGTTWRAMGSVSNTSALLLASDANTRVYFQPATSFSGSVANGLTLRAWDTTSGAAATKVDVSINGGTTAFSAATDTVAIDVTFKNSAPTLTATAISPTFTEGVGLFAQASPVNVFSGATISTIEAGQTITGLTFTVGGLVNGVDEKVIVDGVAIALNANSSGATSTPGLTYTVTSNGVTATVVLTRGTLSGAAAKTLVEGIAYQNTLVDNPTAGNRTFTLTQVKDSGGTVGGGVDTTTLSIVSTVSVVAVNDAPVNTVPEAQPGTEDTTKAITGLSISDVDAGSSGMSVTLTVTNGTLTVTGGTAIIGGSGTSTVTLTGTAAQINATLAATVSYLPTADFNGAATLTMTTSDLGNTGTGGAQTDMDTVTITLAAVADITADTVTTNEDTPISFNAITGTNGATADSFENVGKVLSAVTQGTNGTVIFLADGSLTYTPNANYYGTDSFTYTVTSGGVTETATVTVNVTPVNDAPINTVPLSISVTEDVASPITGISVGDIDSSSVINVTLSVPSGSGTLTALTAGGVTVTGSGSNSLMLAGTQTDINAFISASGVTYTTAANANGSVILTVTTSDLGNTGTGGTLTDVDTVTLNIIAVNDAPVLSLDASAGGTGYTASFTENGAAVQISDFDQLLTDDNANLNSITITLTNPQAGDVLAIGSIPAGINYTLSGSNNSVLTLSGSAPVADYRVALRAVSYANTSDNPITTPRTIEVVANDGFINSNVAVATVNITPVNDAPVLDLDGSNAGTGFTNYFISAGLTSSAVAIADIDAVVSDIDSDNLNGAIITLTNSQADDLLAVGSLPSGITQSIVGNVVTLSGLSSVANYQAALQAITFNNTSAVVNTTPRNFTVTVTDGALLSNSASTTINIATGNIAPIAAVATATGNEDALAGIPITLNAVDPNGSVTSFTLISAPSHGTLYSDAAMTQIALIGTYSAVANSLTLYFRPTVNWAGSTSFNFSATDNLGAFSNTATATLNLIAVADTPNFTVGNSLTQVFNTTWESVGTLIPTANDTNNSSHAKGTAAIEGWSLTTPSLAGAGGVADTTGTDQFYFNADGDQILNSNTSTLYTAAGMQGSATGGDGQRVFLHLDNAANAGGYEAPAITRTINVTDTTHVYQLSLNYAPDAAPAANTGFQVLVDEVVVGTYTADVNQSLVWQAVRTGFNFTTTGNHTIAIRTTSPETGNGDGVGGYFDDIRLLDAQGALQDNYLDAGYGTVTRIALAGKITAALVDTDGSETMSVLITNMPGGARIVNGATIYSPINGQVTVPYAAFSTAYLMFPEDYSGRVNLGVTVTATEGLNGAVASNSQTLTFHVFQPGMASGSPPIVGVVSSTTIVEGDYAVFDIRLNAQLNNDATVVLETTNGTATGADYGASLQYSANGGTTWSNYTGSMVMASGTSSVLVRTTTLLDGSIEGSENFTLKATISSGPTLNTVAIGTATILDLDSAPILQVRPVGQWTFDEGFGVPAVNEYRNIIGTLSDANTTNGNASPAWVTGHSGTSATALQFDGKGASLSVDPVELNPITNSATVSFWIKTTQNVTTDPTQFLNGPDGTIDIGWNRPSVIGSEQFGAVNDAQWGWLDNAGHIGLNVGDTAGAKSTTVVSDNNWHFVAMTRDAGTGKTQIWVDGVLESTVTNAGLTGTITNVFGIGFTNGVKGDYSRRIDNDKYLNAAIDDLRIYDSVLTSEQVLSIRDIETNHHDVGIANDGSSFQFDVTARAFDTLIVHGLQNGWTLTDDAGHSKLITGGVTESVDISTWNFDSPLTVTGVNANQSAMIDITATKGIHQIDQVLNLVSISSAYEGSAVADNFGGTGNSDFIFGNAGNDTLSGGLGDDRLDGGDGNDTLNGGAGSDLLIGGKGNDTLTGGLLGADIFAWKLGDAGTIGAPAADTITDFDISPRSAGGDVLDLRDLLTGETAGTLLGQDNLSNYLHFEKVGNDTVVHISTNGGYAAGFNASLDVQTITLQQVDLVLGLSNDQAIIADLLSKQKLITD